MSDCPIKIRVVYECPVCGRQTVELESDPPPDHRPFICDIGHRRVELEQRLPSAFRAEFQHIDWDSDLPTFSQEQER